MRRILLLTTLAAMMAAAMALAGVAQAKPTSDSPDAKCEKLAIKTLGPSFNPANYTFHSGTEGPNDFTSANTTGADVFCGFGGNDFIGTLDRGDIFLGGEGDDSVHINLGTFNGGEGDDAVNDNFGTFNGGEGNDSVFANVGTFNGGEGDDSVIDFNFETFNGGEGNDSVHINLGTFNGGEGDDTVDSGDPPVDGP